MRPILVIAYWFKSRKNSKRKEHKHQHKCKWHIPNKSQITRSSITALLPNTSSKPNFSKSLWIWIVVFTEKLLPFPESALPMSTFLSWMFTFSFSISTFESPMFTFSSFKSPLIWRFRLWSSFFSFKSKFLRNASRYSVAHTIISISFLYSFFNFDLSWI